VVPKQRKGTGLDGNGAVSGWVRNGSHPQRSEADVWGPRGAGARLAASQGRRRYRPALHTGLGQGHHRTGSAVEKMTHYDFFHFKFFFQLNKSTEENKNRRNTWKPKKNVKFCMEIDLNIFHNFCIGHFDKRSTVFK
jgi:hypothetical protein